ncbi:SDR family oxidoreductase [Enterobacteriaceae bacterium LUAb1]
MKKVAIVGLGWIGMPLAMSLSMRGWQVKGTKTTSDGVDAARMCGIESYLLTLPMAAESRADDLAELLDVNVLIVTLPVTCTGSSADAYLQSVQEIVDSALFYQVPRIVFTSSVSVYGQDEGIIQENAGLHPSTEAGKILVELENWLHALPGTSVDILRLAGLVGPKRHPGRFLAGKTDIVDGTHRVNLVHLDDVVGAIALLLNTSQGGHVYNLCAPQHPSRAEFYPCVARQLGMIPPLFRENTGGKKGKIIDGSKICDDLGFNYRYPDPFKMPVS